MSLPGVQAPQTVYNLIPQPAFAGMMADNGYSDTESALAEVPLDAGLGVVKGASGGATPTVKLPGSSADVTNLFKGVSQYLAAREPVAGSANRFAVGDAVPCVTQGRIWVRVDVAIGSALIDEGPVFLVYTGAGAGMFRGDTGAGGVTATLIPNAKVKIGGTAGSVAQIKVNLP